MRGLKIGNLWVMDAGIWLGFDWIIFKELGYIMSKKLMMRLLWYIA
jgi:hypothetical protein